MAARQRSLSEVWNEEFRSRFEEFWNAWLPERRVGKKAAFKAYAAALRDRRFPVTHDEIVAGAKAYAEFFRMSGKEPQFAPHPATWLNDGRWSDALASGPKPVTLEEVKTWGRS